MEAFDKVDIVVNNAGTSQAMPFDDEILYDDLELKLFAAVRLIRLVTPQMKERRWGRIINVLNIGAKAPRPNRPSSYNYTDCRIRLRQGFAAQMGFRIKVHDSNLEERRSPWGRSQTSADHRLGPLCH